MRDWFCHRRKSGCRVLAGGEDSSTEFRAGQKRENRSAASSPDQGRCRRCGGCEETASPLIDRPQILWWTASLDCIRDREYEFHRGGYYPIPAGSFLAD